VWLVWFLISPPLFCVFTKPLGPPAARVFSSSLTFPLSALLIKNTPHIYTFLQTHIWKGVGDMVDSPEGSNSAHDVSLDDDDDDDDDDDQFSPLLSLAFAQAHRHQHTHPYTTLEGL